MLLNTIMLAASADDARVVGVATVVVVVMLFPPVCACLKHEKHHLGHRAETSSAPPPPSAPSLLYLHPFYISVLPVSSLIRRTWEFSKVDRIDFFNIRENILLGIERAFFASTSPTYLEARRISRRRSEVGQL